jgi:nucleotidyltransferase/DNA polymerase involved in DNA repair
VARVVLYAEVPCFYASVERAAAPELATRPVIVGGDPRKRGLVQAASQDALAAGVHAEMAMLEALQLCPSARAVRTNMPRYREASRRLIACLRRELEKLEAAGLGAVYADASGAPSGPDSIAQSWVARVKEELGFSLRVGIARTKLLARLAAEEAGEGVRRVAPREEEAFLRPLPVTRLEGVGRKTASTLAELGATTIGAVAALGRERLEALFGVHGLRIHASATGVDDAPVRAARHPQSLSREATVAGEPLDRDALLDHLQQLSRQLEDELRVQGLSSRRVTLKIRYAEQGTTTRSQAVSTPLASAAEIHAVAQHLLGRAQASLHPIRGLGIQLAKLVPQRESDRQLDLFSPRR